MTARASILSAGYMPLDVIVTSSAHVTHQAGGTAANVTAILAFLGWEAALAGQAGDDPAGATLVADLKRAGVNTEHVHRRRAMETPRLIHSIQPGGHSFSYTCPACCTRLPRSRPLTIDQAKACAEAFPTPVVYFFDRANAATLALAEHFGHLGSIVVYEPSVPANAELLGRAAAVAHIIKHSDDRSVGGLDDLNIRPKPGQVRIVTHGAEGLELRIGRRRPRRLAALATLAVDTGGAGDWTTAGLLWVAAKRGELRSEDLEDALRFGQALAAISCAVPGARGLMRLTRETVLRRARLVRADGGLASEPRLAPIPPAPSPSGACATCLMPLAQTVSQSAVA